MAMDDRGDKIINLAREMLRADVVMEAVEPSPKTTVSFKVLCLATMLTALGSSAVTEWASEARRPINRYEKTELKALVFYAARLNGVTEDMVWQGVEDRLGIVSFDDLTEQDFTIARRYLQDKAQKQKS